MLLYIIHNFGNYFSYLFTEIKQSIYIVVFFSNNIRIHNIIHCYRYKIGVHFIVVDIDRSDTK